MNITLVIPVLNEEKSIDRLLQSVTSQTLLPSEVIIIDGGSSDSTIEKLNTWKKNSKGFELTVIEDAGANRSQARNIGIERAKSPIVALTDAGCSAKPNWLELLTKPFLEDPETEVVAGFYDPGVKNWFENTMAEYTCTREWNFDAETFLPSSRSIAFTKEIWEKVGKYPEELNTCEDLIFAERLKKKAKHWKVVPEAQVIWDQPKNLPELSSKIFGYATGDLEANYERHVNKIHSAKWRVIALIFLALPLLFTGMLPLRLFGIGLFLLYIAGSWMKHWRILKNPLNFIVLPITQLIVDASLVQAIIFHQISKSYKS